LHDLSKYLSKEIHTVEHQIYQNAGKEFNIKSPKQLAQVLFVDLKIAEKTKKTKSGFSTSADVLEDLVDKHPIVKLVLSYRTLEKLRSTYVDALPLQINPKTHRIHCTFNQSVTATGRLSCQDPNLQNIPVRSSIGTEIRQAFCPEKKDRLFLGADYSQIELRILAHLSEDERLIHAFNHNQDIHRLTASLIFDCKESEVTDEMRYQAKAVNFGIIYGQQAFGLSKELKIPMKEAAEFIRRYFDRYPKVLKFLEKEKEKAKETGVSRSIMGRMRLLEDINSKNPMIRAQAERYAINTPIQGTQSDLIKLAMIKIDHLFKKNHLKSFLILQIHDELIFEVEEEELESVKKIVKETMESIYPMKVPLKVNISVGKNWGEC
jgi:DNA polymerase-1